MQVRAEEESRPQQSTDKKDGRRLSFAPNSRSVRLQLQCSRIRPVLRHVHSLSEFALQGIGYTDDDSAGQTNIFAVEVRVLQMCS